jgi:hypothetical protein
MGQFLWSGVSARPWNVAADRFAREIVRILTLFVARSRRLNGNPFGGCNPVADPLVSSTTSSDKRKGSFPFVWHSRLSGSLR